MVSMPGYLSIGDFSRATHLTIKTLRHYHQLGLLEAGRGGSADGLPALRPGADPCRQVIRCFRDLGMPLDEIQGVLSAPDPRERNERIAGLRRLEAELGRTQAAVASLRDLLAPPPGEGTARIELRSVPAAGAAAITEVVRAEKSVAWLQGALGELFATLAAQDVAADGPAGGIFADALFTEHCGEVTIFVPSAGPVRPLGRVSAVQIPAVELAVIEHGGPPAEVDRAYGVLAASDPARARGWMVRSASITW